MKKCFFSLAVLFAASTLSAAAASSEADFTTAKDQAISRLTSWTESSPYALEALNTGIANLNSLTFSSFANADAAVTEVNSIFDQTMTQAHEQLSDEVYRVFVSLTTDALMANPVDGKATLVGGERLLADRFNVPFQAYEERVQCSTWIFNNAAQAGTYTLRNNNCNYLTYRDYMEPDDEDLSLSRTVDKDGYTIAVKLSVDFADNGRMTLMQGDKYLATRDDGSVYLTDTFGPASSWKITRAVDKKFDKPRLSTKKDPIYYVIRNSNYPDLCLYGTGYYKFMNLGPITESGQWYFVDSGRENGSYYAYSKSGYVIGWTQALRMYTFTSPNDGGPIYTYLRDGNEQYGLCLLMVGEGSYTYSDTNPGHFAYDPKDGYVDMNQVVNTYHDWLGDPGIFSWYLEEINDAELSTLLVAQNEAISLLKSYLTSQPWAVDYLTQAIDKIQNVSLSAYASGEEAANAVKEMLQGYVDGLPAVVNSEIGSFFKAGSRVALYNRNRGVATNAEGKPLASVTSNGASRFNTVVGLPDSISAYEFEVVRDGVYKIKTLKGTYLGAMKAGSPVEGVDKASAAEYRLSFIDGYVALVNSTGRTGLYLDAANGDLTVNQPSDKGSQWVIGLVSIVQTRGDSPKISTDTEKYYYVIRSVGDPNKYIRTSVATWYMSWDVEEDRSYFYLTRAEDGNGVILNSMIYDGSILCINTDENGNVVGQSPVWYNKNTTRNDFKSDWYIVPNEYGTKEGFFISTSYPITPGSCVSVVSPGGNFTAITCGMGNAEDYLNTAFIFEYREGLDHERLFNVKRDPIVETLRRYLTSQPWFLDRFAAEVEFLENCQMTDFGADSYVAGNSLISYYNRLMNELEEEMDYAPEDWVVAIGNVRRGADSKAYLAGVNGKANTIPEINASSTWALEYYSNGRYFLKNDNGEYLGDFASSNMTVTTDRDRAGHFQIAYYNGYITIVDRNNPSAGALNVDASNGNACKAAQADEGSYWTMEVVRESSLADINAAAREAVEFFDLRGIRVSESDLTPGVYLKRSGTKVQKVIVK